MPYYFLANTFGIKLIPINEKLLLSSNVVLNLPEESECALFICDPIWFIGKNIDRSQIDHIKIWQEKYRNLVFVDGAFQYQRWENNHLAEETSNLSSDFTFRNICPTKSVSIHGPRFAYSIVPSRFLEEMRYCYSNTAGSSSFLDFKFSHDIMDWLLVEPFQNKILKFTKERYQKLIALGVIKDDLGAEASYFCFIKKNFHSSKYIGMGQEYL